MRVEPAVLGVELVLLRREAEPPLKRPRPPIRKREIHRLSSVVLKAPKCLAVLGQLLVCHAQPTEVPPPAGSRLPAVVVEQASAECVAVTVNRRGQEPFAQTD